MQDKILIPISEIFYSLQWEWRNVWKSSIFIRFWWCNLKCDFCDSKYSWDPLIEKAQMMHLEEIIKKIQSYPCKHIIFTWWEPTLFQEQIIAIQDKLLSLVVDCDYYSYELETNWSKELTRWINLLQTNISPKLWMSWNKEYDMQIFNSIWWTWNKDLKFVIWNLKDIKEMEQFLKKYKEQIKDMLIYLMPLWIDIKSQINHYLIQYCLLKNYRYCTRSHLLWFWNWKWK